MPWTTTKWVTWGTPGCVGGRPSAAVHVLRLGDRVGAGPVRALDALEEAPGRQRDRERERLLLVLAPEGELGRQEPAFLRLSPEDQSEGRLRGLRGESQRRAFVDLLEHLRGVDHGQRRLRRAG